MRRGRSLAAQLLVLQLAIVSVVLLGVGAVSLAQSEAGFRQVEGRRVLSVAETVAASTTVRAALQGRAPRAALAPIAEINRSVSGASYVDIATADGMVLTSADPDHLRRPLALNGSRVLEKRVWVGVAADEKSRSVVAHVPVLSAGQPQEPRPVGEFVGVVAVGSTYPTLGEQLLQAVPNLATYLGLASVFGIAGSLLLARRVKRQTLGLEPREITGMVEHREAMLGGIKEGIIGLDPHSRVTIVNAQARHLLNLPGTCVGESVADLALDQRLIEVLTGLASAGPDQVALVGERVLTLNRMPVSLHGRPIGSVTTMRDLTELNLLQRELGATRQTTDALRAQAHEFANRLHTISGLIELGEYPQVARYVQRLGRATRQLSSDVTARIADPSLAALLIAKASLAAERGVTLRLDPVSRLGTLDEQLSDDLTTIVGNLVNNALDAMGPNSTGTVDVRLTETDGQVCVMVRDSGPGIAPDLVEEVFERGFTTKAAAGGARGFGLALTRSICARRGGSVSVSNEGGAVFAARLPVAVREGKTEEKASR